MTGAELEMRKLRPSGSDSGLKDPGEADADNIESSDVSAESDLNTTDVVKEIPAGVLKVYSEDFTESYTNTHERARPRWSKLCLIISLSLETITVIYFILGAIFAAGIKTNRDVSLAGCYRTV